MRKTLFCGVDLHCNAACVPRRSLAKAEYRINNPVP